MRPSTSPTCARPSSSLSRPFWTCRSTWPWVTVRASARPASTRSCRMSLRTTGIPAAAIVCAIWPPMVPAPTTAALKTNMGSSLLLCCERGGGGYRQGMDGEVLTERLRCRAPRDDEHDRSRYEELLLSPEIQRWLQPSPLEPLTAADVAALLSSDVAHWPTYGFGPWVLELREDGRFAGRGGLKTTTVRG